MATWDEVKSAQQAIATLADAAASATGNIQSLKNEFKIIGTPDDKKNYELAKDIHDCLVKFYDNATKYDLHYSTVRSGIATLLIGIAITVLSISFKQDALQPVGVGLTWLVLTFAILVSLHFQRLTSSCQEIQKDLEISLNEIRPVLQTRQPIDADSSKVYFDKCKFRVRLDDQFKLSLPYFDIPAAMVITGAVALLTMITIYIQIKDRIV